MSSPGYLNVSRVYNMENKLLEKYISDYKTGLALDIGCGSGKNTSILVRKGFNVDAIDINPDAVQNLITLKNVNIKTIDIRNYQFTAKQYDIILANFVLDFMKTDEIKNVIINIITALNKNGIFYFSVFSTSDPFYKRLHGKIKEIEKNTYYIEKAQTYRHFFTRDELEKLLKPLEIVEVEQNDIDDFDEKFGSHRHNIIELIAKKKTD